MAFKIFAVLAVAAATPAAAQNLPYVNCITNPKIPPSECNKYVSKTDTYTSFDYRNTPEWKDHELRALKADIEAKQAIDSIERDARLRRSRLRP